MRTNPTLETIFARRSVRSFLKKPVPREDLEQIVKAGQFAPSGMNTQSWHFTVLTRRETMQRLARAVAKEIGAGDNYCFYDPAALILVSVPKNSFVGYCDCACALENIFLAAWSLGVGSVWINQMRDAEDRPAVRAILDELGVPHDHLVGGMAALGYYETAPDPKPRREGTAHFVD